MKKFLLLFTLLIVTFSVYARQVDNSNQGIANASPGDHIIRSNGQRVVLTQNDINYARSQLGLSTNTQNRPAQSQTASNTQNRAAQSSNSDYGPFLIFLLVVVVIIIIIGVSVSNITTTVAKNSGMYEDDAKKVGASAGVLAGTAAAIAAAALLGKAGGVKPNPNDFTITHKLK